MTEEWRPIDGFSDYEVSDLGRIRTWRRSTCSKSPRSQPTILAGQSRDKGGYARVKLQSDDGVATTLKIHTLVCSAWHGPRPEGLIALHRDGDSENNSQANLRWGTHAENSADAKKHGRWARGTMVPQARLDEAKALAALKDPRTAVEVASDLGVTPGCIQHLRRGLTWKHIHAQTLLPQF